MKILYVSDYEAWIPCFRKEMPSHHLYGVYEMIDYYDKKRKRGYLKKEISDGYIDFCYVYKPNNASKAVKAICRFQSCLSIWIKSFRYDIVYDAIDQCTPILGLFNRFHLMKAKLITMLHHPPFRCEFQAGLSNAYIFFDKSHMSYSAELNNSLIERMFVCEWGPDFSWYDGFRLKKESKEYFVLDSGHTARDHELLAEACNDLELVAGLPKGSVKKYERIKEIPVDYNMKTYIINLLKCRVIGIPILKRAFPRREYFYEKIIFKLFGKRKASVAQNIPVDPVGYTSLMDALALNIPVIVSDNTLVSNFVKRYHIGIVYEAGNLASLKNALEQMQDEKKWNNFKDNLLSIRMNQNVSIEKFSKELFDVFRYVLR